MPAPSKVFFFNPRCRRKSCAAYCSTLLLACIVLVTVSAHSADPVTEIAASVLKREFSDLGDTLEIVVQPARQGMATCKAPTAFLRNRQISRSGRLFVGIKCHGQRERTFYLQATLKVTGTYLIAAEAISAGTLIREDMLGAKAGDITSLLGVAAISVDEAVGRVAKRNFDAGSLIKKHHLEEQLLVERGQPVSLDIIGDGFKISSQGEALQGGNLGDMIEVRTAGRKTLAGRISGRGIIRVTM
jgi:flagella basal body P-ring formation protein FlgA